jgi:opacity protein-like surface antigen
LRNILFTMLLLCGASLAAQETRKNELGLLLGATVTPGRTITPAVVDPNINIGTGLTFQATYARRVTNGRTAALYLEVPFVAMPNAYVRSGTNAVPEAYASLFVTPGLRVRFAPTGRVSPWLSLGGGYARFDESSVLQDKTPNPGSIGTNAGALQLGGGLDFRTGVKVVLPLDLRVEVRDFYSGRPNYNFATGGSGQHNVVVSGGLVLRF